MWRCAYVVYVSLCVWGSTYMGWGRGIDVNLQDLMLIHLFVKLLLKIIVLN